MAWTPYFQKVIPKTQGVTAGPPRVLAIVVEWGSLHQAELRENWSRLRDHKDPFPIAPLA